MIKIRKNTDRGMSQLDWLHSRHTFSFAEYHDPAFNGFGVLRVINEDTVQPGQGFGTHSHQDMEIISYVIDGVMEHKDSMGTGSIIKPGEIQRMSAGSGVRHSEFNPSNTDPLHFLQIWIIPSQKGLQPSYEQKTIDIKSNELILIGDHKGSDKVITINQDVTIYVGYFKEHYSTNYTINTDRQLWVQLVKGQLKLNNQLLKAGDGASIVNESALDLLAIQDTEFLVFDLPKG